MNYITTQQTPQYTYNGSVYVPVGTVPAGTEIIIAQTMRDAATGREIGVLANGRLMFIDTLTPLLDDVVKVTAKRLYLGLWIVGGAIAAKLGYDYYKKRKAQKRA